MLTAIERFMAALPPDVDGALVTSDRNRFYLTGFPSTDGAVLVLKGQAYFLTDFRYTEAAERVITSCKVVEYSRIGPVIVELLKKHRATGRILMENECLTLGDAEHYRAVLLENGAEAVTDHTLDRILAGLRMIKTPQEIEKIKASQQITDDAFQHILPMIRPGITEREIALEIEFFMRKQGAEGVAFDLIVVSGSNGSMCHGVPSGKKIEDGDFVTMDTGALLDGYHSDMTRTVAVGHVSEEQRHVYDLVLRAQLAAISAVKPGTACGVVDKAARDLIEAEYPGAFEHSTGHGVGVEIHEWPRFSKGNHMLAKPGMVVSVEPGIYLRGKFGVRIEDLVAVTENGCEDLTKSPKELIIL